MKFQRFQLLCSVFVGFLWLVALPVSAQYTLAPGFIFVTNNGVITITSYISSYLTGPRGQVDIPDSTNGYPVTGISSNAFVDGNPTSVKIPASITNIDEGAFGGCLFLTNLVVEAGNPGYTNVGGLLFNKSMTVLLQYPAGLVAESYLIPGGITRIGADAFSGCGKLINVTLPNTVSSIGRGAFFYCSSLTNIIIPDSVTNIESGAFVVSGLISVTIPNGLTSIGYQMFEGCWNLSSVTIASSVTNLGILAFEFCPALERIYFLGDAPTVGADVFYGDNPVTAYYLPHTAGWDNFSNLTGFPTALWLPELQLDSGLGMSANQFGFKLNWAGGQTVVVEACTNLFNTDWLPVQTNILPRSGTVYFSDPQWTNYPNRFYHLRSR